MSTQRIEDFIETFVFENEREWKRGFTTSILGFLVPNDQITEKAGMVFPGYPDGISMDTCENIRWEFVAQDLTQPIETIVGTVMFDCASDDFCSGLVVGAIIGGVIRQAKTDTHAAIYRMSKKTSTWNVFSSGISESEAIIIADLYDFCRAHTTQIGYGDMIK